MNSTSSAREISRKRMGILVLSTLILLLIGLIYAFSMFARPMMDDFGLTGNIGLTFNIMMITFCLGAVAGSVLDKRFGTRITLLICGVLFACGFCSTGLLAGVFGMPVLYVGYGVIGGLGVGVGYNTIVSTTNLWFPDKVGFSSGVLMMGFGASSLIFGNVALMVRPLVGGMSVVLIGLGIIVALLVVVAAGKITRPPADIVEVMMPSRTSSESASANVRDFDADVIYKTPIFYVYYVWGVIVIAMGLAVIGNCASDAALLGVEMSFATLLVGLVSVCNGVSRLVIGALYDRTNIMVAMLIDGAVGLLAVMLIAWGFVSGAAVFYIAGALLCGFAYGGVPVIASAFARQRFGSARYPFNLSITNLSITFGSLLNIIVALAIGSSNRLGIFGVLIVLGVIAVADVWVFSRMWKREVLGVDDSSALSPAAE